MTTLTTDYLCILRAVPSASRETCFDIAGISGMSIPDTARALVGLVDAGLVDISYGMFARTAAGDEVVRAADEAEIAAVAVRHADHPCAPVHRMRGPSDVVLHDAVPS